MYLYLIYNLDTNTIYKEKVGKLKAIYYEEYTARRKITMLRLKDASLNLKVIKTYVDLENLEEI